ncbi:MAG: aminotransferase class III-fold pyridoxal phosphate-dependent enzyme, partial [Marmoricola sp.]
VEITGAQAAARAIDVIEKQVGADNLSCVVIEPILGEGGFVVPAEGFLPAIADWCTENGVVFVADEIQSGMCRTGAWFACEHEGVVPDLVTVAKGLAGGLPLAGVVGRAEMMDAPHAGGLGGTYGGNPVTCAAALGAIATMEQMDLPARARRIGDLMGPRLTSMKENVKGVGDVRGRGAMMAIEIVHPGTKEPDPETAAKISAGCHRTGVLTLTCGTYGNVLRFLPSLVIPELLLEDALNVVEGVAEGFIFEP